MLEKIIKKAHKKVAFSFYGILSIVTMLLPLVVVGFGIYYMVNPQDTNNYGIFWIVIGVACMVFSIRKLRDFFGVLKYVINPKKYPLYKELVEAGIDISQFDAELSETDIVKSLSKNNPLIMTDNFIFGYSQVSFFAMNKNEVMWAYEYSGNGIVFYDYHKNYGFTYFPTVDGNDHVMDQLKYEMPYIYLGLEFDYKKLMHEEFEQTRDAVIKAKEEFMADPDAFREKVAALEREKAKAEEERLALEKAKLENAAIESKEENKDAEVIEEIDASDEANDQIADETKETTEKEE